MAGIRTGDAWKKARRKSLTVTKGIMEFIEKEYGRRYAPNTRETVRRQALHQFFQARVADYNPDDPTLPTNSPKAHYALSEEALAAIKTYGTSEWPGAAKAFVESRGSLEEKYRDRKARVMVPVTLPDGRAAELSPGEHNRVQAAVIMEFAPRFAPGSKVLYLGDTAKKNLIVAEDILKSLGVPMSDHDKLPDVVLLDETKKWLYLVEAVTSHGPMTPKRVFELEKMFSKCGCGRIYVTAFPDMSEFRKHLRDVAWETEVWLADIPDHMIHYNGDRFLGPRES